MSNPQMQAVAAAASIGQEKVTERVEFAITGDTETDLVAAIVACTETLCREPNLGPVIGSVNEMAARVCAYLAGRFKSQAEAVDRPYHSQQTTEAALRAQIHGLQSQIDRLQLGPISPPASIWGAGGYTTSSSSATPGDFSSLSDEAKNEYVRRLQSEIIRQASTQRPEYDALDRVNHQLLAEEEPLKPYPSPIGSNPQSGIP